MWHLLFLPLVVEDSTVSDGYGQRDIELRYLTLSWLASGPFLDRPDVILNQHDYSHFCKQPQKLWRE